MSTNKMTRCARHKLEYPKGGHCPKCEATYDAYKRNRQSTDFYNSKKWKSLRTRIINYYANVDIWFLGLTGKLKPCLHPTVHHIEELSKRPELGVAESNLVVVSQDSHTQIHSYYESGRREEAVNIINLGKKRFEMLRNGN